MLIDLRKIKIEQNTTSTSTALAISKKKEKDVFSEDSNFDSSSSTPDFETVFELLEVKIFVGKPNFMSFTTNLYTKPTLPDMQFEERFFQTQFSISANKLYEWNIDGLLEQEIINKMGYMSVVANAYITNHNLDHAEIVDLLTTDFSGTLCGLWEKYLMEESRESIKKAVKKE